MAARAVPNDAGQPARRSWPRKVGDFLLWFLKDQWFLVGTGTVTAIASQVQVPADQQAIKQTIVSYLSVAVIFFITGCKLDPKVLLANITKWRQHLFIQIQSFLMISALAFAVVSLAALNKNFMNAWFLIGLIMNGVQPTAIASNITFTEQAHGNAVLTTVESTIGNLIGPFLSPILMQMYMSSDQWYTTAVPRQSGGYGLLYQRVFKQFGLSIYLPLVLGQLVRYCFPKPTRKVLVEWHMSKLGSFGLLALMWQTFDHAFSTGALQSAKASNLIFIVFITVVNYFLWLTICVLLSKIWFDRKDTVSVAMCVPAKTLALGIPMSALFFTGITSLNEAQIQVPIVIFQIMQQGMASLCSIGFRKWVDAEERKKSVGAQLKTDEENVQSLTVIDHSPKSEQKSAEVYVVPDDPGVKSSST